MCQRSISIACMKSLIVFHAFQYFCSWLRFLMPSLLCLYFLMISVLVLLADPILPSFMPSLLAQPFTSSPDTEYSEYCFASETSPQLPFFPASHFPHCLPPLRPVITPAFLSHLHHWLPSSSSHSCFSFTSSLYYIRDLFFLFTFPSSFASQSAICTETLASVSGLLLLSCQA